MDYIVESIEKWLLLFLLCNSTLERKLSCSKPEILAIISQPIIATNAIFTKTNENKTQL